MDELGEVLEVMDELETSGEILSEEDAAESLKESVETVESGTENTLLQDNLILIGMKHIQLPHNFFRAFADHILQVDLLRLKKLHLLFCLPLPFHSKTI